MVKIHSICTPKLNQRKGTSIHFSEERNAHPHPHMQESTFAPSSVVRNRRSLWLIFKLPSLDKTRQQSFCSSPFVIFDLLLCPSASSSNSRGNWDYSQTRKPNKFISTRYWTSVHHQLIPLSSQPLCVFLFKMLSMNGTWYASKVFDGLSCWKLAFVCKRLC